MSIFLVVGAPLLLFPNSKCCVWEPLVLVTGIGLSLGSGRSLRRGNKLLLIDKIDLNHYIFYFGRKLEGAL